MLAKGRYVLVILSLLLQSIQSQNTTPDSIVDLGYARYRGLHNSTLKQTTYYGLHYAHSPTGTLRWKSAIPIARSNPHNPPNHAIANSQNAPVINATIPAATCIQGNPGWYPQELSPPNDGSSSEDCLTLNVIVPSSPPSSELLPVVVTIHGGGYTTGSALFTLPSPLFKHTTGSFIGVSLQYRLGAYGFLGSRKFVSEGGETNLGLRDQRVALEWVRENIARFGGDPDKIVIWGSSAGGGSLTAQMVYEGGGGEVREGWRLFRGSVVEYPWWQQFLRDEQLERQYGYLLRAAGCKDLACLRGVDEKKLANSTREIYGVGYETGEYPYGSFWFGPYVDGDIMKGLPSEEFEGKRFIDRPLLIDRDMYEGWSFTNMSLETKEDEEKDLRTVFPYATAEFRKRLDEVYPREAFNSTLSRRATWFGDMTIHCPTRLLAEVHANAWKLVFNAGTQTHAATAFFLYDLPDMIGPKYNATLAAIMKDWVGSFAVHVDPNIRSWSNVSKPHWDEYHSTEKRPTVLANQTEIGVPGDLDLVIDDRCQFWRQYRGIAQN
ncbi:alpha/beta-hydrolase [Aaosphaeria arxii CBS 175.79]|uniref:Carboxylic ester hydrolase n=1 Tax=Aaosphaeria arxii CBS 175.79 TaxID=1450172 RepID=A0A6A5Y3X7_9PLEO|nr:alpha/beta-hydrolase [Aaosphaeria arxii CBS 175.79]KAF2019520.1 alpha/beta-hydrolase [Aaosphaeria arxii CBS 175.79]